MHPAYCSELPLPQLGFRKYFHQVVRIPREYQPDRLFIEKEHHMSSLTAAATQPPKTLGINRERIRQVRYTLIKPKTIRHTGSDFSNRECINTQILRLASELIYRLIRITKPLTRDGSIPFQEHAMQKLRLTFAIVLNFVNEQIGETRS